MICFVGVYATEKLTKWNSGNGACTDSKGEFHCYRQPGASEACEKATADNGRSIHATSPGRRKGRQSRGEPSRTCKRRVLTNRRPRRTWGKSCRSGNIFQEPSSRPPSYKLPSGIISHTTKCSTSFPIAWLLSRRKVNPVSRSTMHVAEQVFVPVSDAELPAAGIPRELFDLGFVP